MISFFVPSKLNVSSDLSAATISAASAFVELLHLKTWDFVALDQPHAYGDISIVKAACFHDEVPAAA